MDGEADSSTRGFNSQVTDLKKRIKQREESHMSSSRSLLEVHGKLPDTIQMFDLWFWKK